MNKEKLEKLKKVVSLFKIDDKPLELVQFQLDIVYSIVYKERNRVIVLCPTQSGKSEAVAIACIIRAVQAREDFVIVGPTNDKAQIIMSKIIEHCFDNDYWLSQLEVDENITLDKIRKERSKSKISFKNGGSIKVLSADARNSNKNFGALMGEGATNVICDESSLIPDRQYASILRMIGGKKNGFIFEIGNPWKTPDALHFYETWINQNNYHKIFIDYKQAIEQGRFTREFIEEMRGRMPKDLFKVYYECEFVERTSTNGLITASEFDNAIVNVLPTFEEHTGLDAYIGLDVAREGKDRTVATLIYKDVILESILFSYDKSKDISGQIANDLIFYAKSWLVLASNIFVDTVGVGGGVQDACRRIGWDVKSFKAGAKDVSLYQDGIKFENLRSACIWLLANNLRTGKLKIHKDYHAINELKSELLIHEYAFTSAGRLAIMSKDEVKKSLGKSPDIVDSCSMALYSKLKGNKKLVDLAGDVV